MDMSSERVSAPPPSILPLSVHPGWLMTNKAHNTQITAAIYTTSHKVFALAGPTVSPRSPIPQPQPVPQQGTSLTTETLYRAPPTSVPPSPSDGTENGEGSGGVPIAAIAGGAAAGALLAIVVVVGWVLWGRAIKRDAALMRLEAATRRNTMQNANTGTISRVKAHSRYTSLHGRPAEKAVAFAAPPISTASDTNTPLKSDIMAIRTHPTHMLDQSKEKIPNAARTKPNGVGMNNGTTQGAAANGTMAIKGPAVPQTPTATSPRAQPPPPPPVSQTRGKRPAYSRRSLKPAPRGILVPPSSPLAHGQSNRDGPPGQVGQVNGQQGQGHQRQESAATVTPLLADYYMDENRVRRGEVGDVESLNHVRRTPSGLLWAALGLGGGGDRNSRDGERNSRSGERNSRNSLRTRDSRWSWTSSLDLKLFGKTHREDNRKSARTTVVSSEEDRASGSVSLPMGVAV